MLCNEQQTSHYQLTVLILLYYLLCTTFQRSNCVIEPFFNVASSTMIVCCNVAKIIIKCWLETSLFTKDNDYYCCYRQCNDNRIIITSNGGREGSNERKFRRRLLSVLSLTIRRKMCLLFNIVPTDRQWRVFWTLLIVAMRLKILSANGNADGGRNT